MIYKSQTVKHETWIYKIDDFKEILIMRCLQCFKVSSYPKLFESHKCVKPSNNLITSEDLKKNGWVKVTNDIQASTQ